MKNVKVALICYYQCNFTAFFYPMLNDKNYSPTFCLDQLCHFNVQKLVMRQNGI